MGNPRRIEMRRLLSCETLVSDKSWTSKLHSKVVGVRDRGKLSAFSDEVGG